ncbi:MAG: hypothetical protein CMP50_01815 [Flavobacteriales bacterium]|nr:hypothetical protein [Flavobacteriales bacterium]|tara:strand:- start:402 stop:1130 length:729 start_codon:yes stop_codon:yes gene_type:complete
MYQSIIQKHTKISLNEETHTYTLLNSELNFMSVTEFINTFFHPFDENIIAEKLSGKGKYKHMSSKDILKDWEQRRNRGTIVHKEIEQFVENKETINQETLINFDLKSKQGINFLKKKCLNNENIVFSEVKIISETLQLAGTIDLMIYNKKHNKIYLIDWKTNISIKKQGYNKGIKPPVDVIDDCSFNRYTLQLSMYSYILANYYNASVGGLYIVHLKNEEYNIMECVFEESFIVDMIQSRIA